jgi:hypothetical protein
MKAPYINGLSKEAFIKPLGTSIRAVVPKQSDHFDNFNQFAQAENQRYFSPFTRPQFDTEQSHKDLLWNLSNDNILDKTPELIILCGKAGKQNVSVLHGSLNYEGREPSTEPANNFQPKKYSPLYATRGNAPIYRETFIGLKGKVNSNSDGLQTEAISSIYTPTNFDDASITVALSNGASVADDSIQLKGCICGAKYSSPSIQKICLGVTSGGMLTYQMGYPEITTTEDVRNQTAIFTIDKDSNDVVRFFKNNTLIRSDTDQNNLPKNRQFHLFTDSTINYDTSAGHYEGGIALMHFGQSLTTTERTALYTHIKTFLEALGVPSASLS